MKQHIYLTGVSLILDKFRWSSRSVTFSSKVQKLTTKLKKHRVTKKREYCLL